MKKLHITLTAILLTSALFLSGCVNQDLPLYGSNDSLNNSDSSDNSSAYKSTSTASESSDHSDSSADESSTDTSTPEISNDYVNIETFEYDDFTEDDLWLQSFLKENYPMALFLFRTYTDNFYEPEYELNPDAEHKSQYILTYSGTDFPYFIVPNTYFNNYEEYQALLDKYFSSDVLNVKIAYADIADAENDLIALRDYTESYEPQLIEINGRLYHVACSMGGSSLPCLDMAKVITKTDDEIVFSYLCYIDNFGNAQPGKGMLKKEDGIWKFSWFYIYQPIELQDIHEVWGV